MRLFRMGRAQCLRRWAAGKCLVAGAEANLRPLVWSPGDDRGVLSVGRREKDGGCNCWIKNQDYGKIVCATLWDARDDLTRDRFEAGRGMSPSRPSFDKTLEKPNEKQGQRPGADPQG